MKVLMTGGTGFLGSALRKHLEAEGHSITSLSRSKRGEEGATSFVGEEALPNLEAHDAVINLSGESVVGLWTRSKRDAIYRSRIDTTRALSHWIEKSDPKPTVFLSSSAVGIYGDAGDRELTETSDVSNAKGFLAKVCRDWEQSASSAAWKGTRTVLLRTGHVLDPSGGYMGQVLPIMRRFPIVILGPGDSYSPWIALDDWIGITLLALRNEAVSGPLNLVSPNPVTQEVFTKMIAAKLGRRVWGRVPRWALKLVAGGFGESITHSQRALPEKALAAGYDFEYKSLQDFLAKNL